MSQHKQNETLSAIFSRRSIRHYTSQAVSDKDIDTILSAAMSAPSAGNEQSWEFIIIRDRSTLDAIPSFHPFAQMLKESSIAIVICGNTTREKFKDYWVLDCSAATQNLLLAAHAIGLGAVWLGIYPMKDRVAGLSKLLNLPPEVIPLSLVPIGHPNEKKEMVDRFDETRIHNEKW